MIAAAQVSAERAGLPKEDIEELVGLIRQLDLPTHLPHQLSQGQILEKVFADKKFVNGKIRFVVSPRLGSAKLAENITVEDLEIGLRAIGPSQT
jgi:3-dehydroquinate synthetase